MNSTSGQISFHPLAGGDEQIARAFHSQGTFEKWRRSVQRLRNYPRVLILLYASFVPPLLMILRTPNFIVDICGRTTTGKTIALRIAGSVWGCPDETAQESTIHSWDSTLVWLERGASLLSGIPIILDDTKRARKPEVVADMLYLLANGKGRGRGNPQSLELGGSWRTVLISSGEAPATSFTQDGGTRTRVLEVRGLAFKGQGEREAKLVARLDREVRANFGHAGPLFVRHLLQNRSSWDHFVGLYQGAIATYADTASTPEAGRLARYMGAIDVAVFLVHDIFEFPWDASATLKSVWRDIAAEAEDAPGSQRALHDLVSWAHANAFTFHGREVNGSRAHVRVPPRGWSGRWDAKAAWESIDFYPHVAKGKLKELGYEPEEILAGWREEGWLIVTSDGKSRYERQRRVERRKTWVISIRREAIDALGS